MSVCVRLLGSKDSDFHIQLPEPAVLGFLLAGFRQSTMSPSEVPDSLEEQDIGLYYHSRGSSLTISDTDISSPVSRPASQPQFDTLGQEFAPHSTHGSLKSPSLSQVADAQRDRWLTAHQPILRSRTVPHLPSSGTENDFPSFAFSAEKVQRMQEWALAFVVGKPAVASQPSHVNSFVYSSVRP